MKKQTLLIAASIIIGSIIISQAIKSSSQNTCFNIMFEELYKKSAKEDKMLAAVAAKKTCQ